jgi:predicted bacteriocin transport accessory protein
MMKKVESTKKGLSKDIIILLSATAIILIIGIIVSLTGKDSNNENVINNGNENENENITEDENVFNEINVDQLVDIFKGNELSIVYIARPDCSHCQDFKPIITEVTKQYNLKINYININTLDTQEKQEKYKSIHGYLYWNGFSTPTILVVKDGAIYDVNSGYVEKDVLVNFLTKNGFIKE